MTQEMVTAMIKTYTRFMKLSDKAYDEGNIEGYTKWLDCALALDIVAKEFHCTFKKTWDGQYVIVEM